MKITTNTNVRIVIILILEVEKIVTDYDSITFTPVKFTPNEWKLLVMLYKANGEMVKRDELIAHIWNGEIHSTRTVDMHLSAVRKKLAYIKGATIKSCYGKGYKFVMLEKF